MKFVSRTIPSKVEGITYQPANYLGYKNFSGIALMFIPLILNKYICLTEVLIFTQNSNQMKKLLFVIILSIISLMGKTQSIDSLKTALLIVDVQYFYFSGGKSELVEPQAAADNAAKLLAYFRQKGWPVVHVKHQSTHQSDIHETVKPVDGEKIFTKKEVSSFNGTGLDEYLKSIGVKNLVICGMQTHMCVEAAVRAGYDLGYNVTLVHDACATKNLKWGDEVVPAKMVHLATLVTLKSYGRVISTQEFLK